MIATPFYLLPPWLKLAGRIFSTGVDVSSVTRSDARSDGSPHVVANPVRILRQMEQALAQMRTYHAAGQKQRPGLR
jgi:hypothetical protein